MMTVMEAMRERHSVRAYKPDPIAKDVQRALGDRCVELNEEHGLHLQLITDEEQAFSGMMSRFAHFASVRNYFALVGPDAAGTEEMCGYAGENLVLYAQQLGLNTCWVGMTYKKKKAPCEVRNGERLVLVIATGYGQTQGVSHKSKPASEVMQASGEIPAWFSAGIDAAMLAPTAVNQQKFLFTLNSNGTVTASTRNGPWVQTDLGIARYHFELGAGKDAFSWA